MQSELAQFRNYLGDDVPLLEKALLEGKTENADQDDTITRKMVVGWIGEFVRSSYRLDSNPLPHLRKLFPKFRWVFLNTNLGDGTSERVAFSKMCLEADIFWDAYNFTCFVGAYRKGPIPLGQGGPWRIWGGATFSEEGVPCHEFRASRVKDTDDKVATDV